MEAAVTPICTCNADGRYGSQAGLPPGYHATLRQACAEHGGLRCFVASCAASVVLTRSWYGGPTLHTCKDHEALLPRNRPDETTARQAVLL